MNNGVLNNKTKTLKIEMMEANIIQKNDPTRCDKNKERIKKQQKPKSKQIVFH
ncbi:hypothetical protein JP0060_14900 [Helicobacter pylori]|nr:hypothetical protein JP0060_14900 [Helicobacter pylori]